MDCTIDNPFHSSRNSCCFIYNADDDKIHHLYHGSPVTLTATGELIVKKLCLKNDIRVVFKSNSLYANVYTGKFDSTSFAADDTDILTLEQYINVTTVRDFMRSQFKMYFDDLTRRFNDPTNPLGGRYHGRSRVENVYMRVKNFLDVYFRSNVDTGAYEIEMFRPTHFTTDLVQCLYDWRSAIVNLFAMCTPLPTRMSAASSVVNQSRRSKTVKYIRQNTKRCSLRLFLKRSAYHLRCKQYGLRDSERAGDTTNSCVHLDIYRRKTGERSLSVRRRSRDIDTDYAGGGDEGAEGDTTEYDDRVDDFRRIDTRQSHVALKSMLEHKDTIPCIKLLHHVLDEMGEAELASLLNFQCLLTPDIIKVINESHRRYELLHPTLCCPKALINEDYLQSLRDFVDR